MVLSSSPPAPPGLPATRLNGSLAAVKPKASAEPGAGAGAEGEARRASRESGLNREGGTSQRDCCASVILQDGGEGAGEGRRGGKVWVPRNGSEAAEQGASSGREPRNHLLLSQPPT